MLSLWTCPFRHSSIDHAVTFMSHHHTPNHFPIRANVVRSAVAETGKRIAEWVRRRIREKLIKFIWRKKRSPKAIWILWRWAYQPCHSPPTPFSPTFLVILSNIRMHCVRSCTPPPHISHHTIPQLHSHVHSRERPKLCFPFFEWVSLRPSRAPKNSQPPHEKWRRNHMRCNVYNCAVGFSPHKY